jgi:hypothetical protein
MKHQLHYDIIKALKQKDTKVVSHLLKQINIDEIFDITHFYSNCLSFKKENSYFNDKRAISSTILWYACYSFDLSFVKMIVNLGANVNMPSVSKSTPLM